MSAGEDQGWTSPLVLGLATVGVIALIAFIFVELPQRQPLLQLRLFGNPIFALAMVINFVTQFSLFGMQYILPLMLQQVHQLGAAATGLVLFPSGIASFITMNISGRIYNRVGPRPLAVSGLAVLMLTTGWLSRLAPGATLVLIGGLASLRGLAMGLCMMPVQTAAYNTVAREEMTPATALTNVLFRIFGAASTALLTTVLVVSLRWQGAPEGSGVTGGNTPINFLSGAFNMAFLSMAIMAAVGIGLALFLRDPVLEKLREQPAGANAERLHVEPAD